jgi:hypothetical protein
MNGERVVAVPASVLAVVQVVAPAAVTAAAVVASIDAMLFKARELLITSVPLTCIAIFVFLHY